MLQKWKRYELIEMTGAEEGKDRQAETGKKEGQGTEAGNSGHKRQRLER
jgi:hypothetical protein